jgi:hypothetical protein
MKLTDLDRNNVAAKALKESFAFNFDTSNLDRPKTLAMLKKVSGLIKESRRSPDFHKAETNPTYMKMLFMEQALTEHMKVAKSPRIVLENEEVEKSQVILAAQDMVDSIQKMYEDVNDMLVKELPALVDSVESEIGVNEATSFSDAATQSLTALNAALQEAQTTLKGALGGLTGQGGADAFAMGAPEMDADLGAEAGADLGADMGDEELPAEEPGAELPPLPDMDDEEDMGGKIGRAKR